MSGTGGEFVRVCSIEDVADGEPTAFTIPGTEDPSRVLVKIGDEVFALSGTCPHESGDLSEGIVENGVLWCPVHASGFDCRTGAVVHPPAEQALGTYPVIIQEGSVHVRRERES